MDRDALDQLPALPDDDDLVPSSVVKRENGGICDMTLWRWTKDPRSRIQFPPPDIVINGRNYWKRRTLRQHRYQMELEKPHPVKGAASFVQSPRRQTRSTHPPQKEERPAREADRRR